MRKRKKTNGKTSRGPNPDRTFKARKRVLKVAKQRGIISAADAKRIGRWGQSWFHLNAMVEAGQLMHAGYNQWLPVKRKYARSQIAR